MSSFISEGRLFTITYHRYGCSEGHIYLGTLHNSYEEALLEASEHISLRAGKYSAKIYEGVIGGPFKLYRDLPEMDRLDEKEIKQIKKKIKENYKAFEKRKKFLKERNFNES